MEKRVALVIGNGNYTEAGFLNNPSNDAIAISAVLPQFGFQIIGGAQDGVDLDYGKFAARIRDFGRALRDASVALLFYAGHGLQVAGRNYLVPVDATLELESDVGTELIELQIILNQMERPGRTSIVILDACRNNPLAQNLARAMGLDGPRAAAITEGLAEQKVVAGTLIAFATQPGHVAYDGAGRNGYFTEALLEQIERDPARDVEVLLRDARVRVVTATQTKALGAQVPWVHSSLMGVFSFGATTAQQRQPEPVASVTGGQSILAIAAAEWAQIKDSTDTSRLERFAQHFDGTYHAGLARDRIFSIEAEIERFRALAELEAKRQREEEEQRNAEADRHAGGIPVCIGTGSDQDEVRKIKAGSGESFRDIDVGPEMVVIPAGSFIMGSPRDEPERESQHKGSETPQHRITIAEPFSVGRYPVTRGQFSAFVDATGYKTFRGSYVWNGMEWKHDPKQSWRDPGFCQDDTHPIVCVHWENAKAYANWLSQITGKCYRLLSEAEWEYVCRARTTTPFWWGKSITSEHANYDGNYTWPGENTKGYCREQTLPVRSFQPNPWGLYQVHGNVWEWCEDVWHDTYDGAPTDGSAWTDGSNNCRVIRGGSWGNHPGNLRAASRHWSNPVMRNMGIGFRVCRTLSS